MIKIYDHVFGAPGTDESKMTQYLTRKIEQFSWVQERHLDLPFQLGASLEVAQAELLRVNGFRCPKDKLTILQNVIKIIADLAQKQDSSAGNDQLLPILILVIIRSNPPALISNVNGGKLQPPPPRSYSRGGASTAGSAAGSTAGKQASTASGTANPQAQAVASYKVNEVATNIYSSTLKMFDTTASAIKSAAETAAITVDGFAQGLMERFKDDKQIPPPSGGPRRSADGDRTSSSPPPLPPRERNWMAKLSPSNRDQPPAESSRGQANSGPQFGNLSTSDLANTTAPVALPPNDILPRKTDDRFTNAKDMETFETALSEAERGMLEDYDLQLALALSMSIEENRVYNALEVEQPATGTLIDFSDETETTETQAAPPPHAEESSEKPKEEESQSNAVPAAGDPAASERASPV
ncbi:hypothetical protein HDU96_006697 [Phlyctochytrium bullatum]|nr:hypothetical protein HDU96_006697 [Phlyctochytrium bullatum]